MLLLQRKIRRHLSPEPCHLSNERKTGFRNAVLVARIVPLTNSLLNQQGLLILVQLQPDALGDNESSYDYFQHRNFLHKKLFPIKTSFTNVTSNPNGRLTTHGIFQDKYQPALPFSHSKPKHALLQTYHPTRQSFPLIQDNH